MNNKPPLGILEKVELRKYREHEATEFTPWLAKPENIQLLGESLGLELEVDCTEKDVGPFRADILCKETITNNWVLIENQLEKTDHSHLGQIFTYAAGLKATTIIRIADQFTEEHRSALDWLNEISGEGYNFFGIEMELWRIGDSLTAPKFNIVSKPNEWSKTLQSITRAGEFSETEMLQKEYWTQYKQYMEENSKIKCQKPYPQNWNSHSFGKSGMFISSVVTSRNLKTNQYYPQIRVELYLHGKYSKQYYSYLESKKEELEAKMGEPLYWYCVPCNQSCRIYVQTSGDFNQKELWTEQFVWLKEKVEKFFTVLVPVVKQIDPVEIESVVDINEKDE